jgi:hypothetical protein
VVKLYLILPKRLHGVIKAQGELYLYLIFWSKGKKCPLLHIVQTDSGVYPASYPVGTGERVSFPGGKASGA